MKRTWTSGLRRDSTTWPRMRLSALATAVPTSDGLRTGDTVAVGTVMVWRPRSSMAASTRAIVASRSMPVPGRGSWGTTLPFWTVIPPSKGGSAMAVFSQVSR